MEQSGGSLPLAGSIFINLNFKAMKKEEIKNRLEYLREEIKQERISYGELLELQSLAEYIEEGDVELLEWAGVPEK